MRVRGVAVATIVIVVGLLYGEELERCARVTPVSETGHIWGKGTWF